jgi:hypothetical protein
VARWPWTGGSAAAVLPLGPGGRRAVLLAFLLLLAALLLLGGRLLQDPDTYWHIVVGDRMLTSGELPRRDEFSHSFAGAPWIAKEWLSQVMLALAWRAAGWAGVAALAAASCALAMALLFGFLLRRLRWTAALAATLLALLLTVPQMMARPHAFFLPVLVAWVAVLIRAVEQGRAPPWWLAGLMALWANLHASFPLGLVIAALFGAEALLTAPDGARWRLALRWLGFGLLALGATVLTPYGVAPLRLAVVMFGTNDAVRFIQEWQPPEPGAAGWLAMGAFGLGMAALLAFHRPAPRLLPVLPLAWLAAKYRRFTGPFGIVAAMALAGPLARHVPALAPLPLARGPGAWATGCAAAAVLCIALLVRPEPAASVTPRAALDAALEAGATGPVLNDHDFGGYLIWRGVPTFIDGRNDQLFIGGFAAAWYGAQAAEDDAAFLELLRRHGVTWALLRPDGGAARKLDRLPGWRRVHADATAVVFLRGG